MLHERTVPLAELDAVAVRDEDDTMVLYAEHLTPVQQAALRRYLLDALAGETEPAATVTVSAGATEQVLAGTKGRRPVVAPFGLAGAALFTILGALVASVFVAAVVVLLTTPQLDDRAAGSLRAAGGRPSVEYSPPVEAPLVAGDPGEAPSFGPGPSPEGVAPRSPLELPVGVPLDVQGFVQGVAPAPAVPPVTSRAVPPIGAGAPATAPPSPAVPSPAAPGTPAEPPPPDAPEPTPSAAEEPGSDLPDVDLPDVDPPGIHLPDVELPDLGGPIDVPDVELPDVEVPEVELPEVDLPDVDLPAAPDLPDVELPDVELPDVDVPDIDLDDDERADEESEQADDESGEAEDAPEEDSDEQGGEADEESDDS